MNITQVKPLLPNEPRQLDWDVQSQLTKQFLTPVLRELERFLLDLRAELDPLLSADAPTKAGKPYPLGQCLEISLAVKKKFEEILASDLRGDSLIAFRAIQQFVRNGGVIRQIWGDLRGQYFQNAFLFGDLYVDVSNDTVVATKPKVEILPFAQANLSPIKDFYHFAQLARSYWKAEIFPNHILPELAPYVPLLVRYRDGEIQMLDLSGYMIMLNTSAGFKPSNDFLSQEAMPKDIFERVKSILQDSDLLLPERPVEGRAMALLSCQRYSEDVIYRQSDQILSAVERALKVNVCLSQIDKVPSMSHHQPAEMN